MWQLASAIGEITLRRRGPEALPDSRFLTGLLLSSYVLVHLIYFSLHAGVTWLALGNLVAQIAFAFVFIYAVLTFFKLERRYRQTMSAFFGINVVVVLVYLPIAIGALALNFDLAGRGFQSVRLGFLLWSVVIEAHIFARALSQPLILGFMFAILYVLPSMSVSEYFSPASD